MPPRRVGRTAKRRNAASRRGSVWFVVASEFHGVYGGVHADTVKDALERARVAYERAGLGCIVSLRRGEPRYATVTELAARLGPEDDMLILLTAISDAVERYDPKQEAVVMIESEKGFEVSIISASGTESVGGLFYKPKEA